MLVKKSLAPLSLLFASLLHVQVEAQMVNVLPRSTPEAEGVSAKAIITFLDSVANSKHEFHSFMLVRHGKVIAEGWWSPYRADLKHTLYSLSKSFTATAVGFARAEKKLSLTDKVSSFFPSQQPDSSSANLQALTVKDLLTMSVGQEPDPTGITVQDSNWVNRFLALPIKYQPGTKFLYNSMATYVLSAIVQKVTGQKIVDYLKPRLFEPLGIEGMDWETDPKGTNTGGWGLRLKTEDIARFAQLFLQKGVWNGKQILPKGWAEEASTAKIIQHPEYSQAKRDSSDWEQGYCYQMWRCRNNAFRGDGAFGQYAIVMPGQDAVIAITSETSDMQGELNLIWKLLLPAMQNNALPADKNADDVLKKKLGILTLSVKGNAATTPTAQRVSGKNYALESNSQNIQSIKFDFNDNICQVQFQTDSSVHAFNFGLQNWEKGETTIRGPYLVAGAKNSLNGLSPFKVAGAYTWLDANTLQLVLRYIESPHSETFLCRFNGNDLELKRSFSMNLPGGALTVKGVKQE